MEKVSLVPTELTVHNPDAWWKKPTPVQFLMFSLDMIGLSISQWKHAASRCFVLFVRIIFPVTFVLMFGRFLNKDSS